MDYKLVSPYSKESDRSCLSNEMFSQGKYKHILLDPKSAHLYTLSLEECKFSFTIPYHQDTDMICGCHSKLSLLNKGLICKNGHSKLSHLDIRRTKCSDSRSFLLHIS